MGTPIDWQAKARQLRAQGKTSAEIAALIQQDPAAVREALRAASRPKPPADDGTTPLGAGAAFTVLHVPRVPRTIIDQAALQAAALAFARNEIDRNELIRRISR